MSDNIVKWYRVLPLVVGLAATGCSLGQKGDLYLLKDQASESRQPETGQPPEQQSSKATSK